jgi:8-oxo-dGTP diphosphatase
MDESDEDCALREVYEETGYLCQLGHEIARVSYLDRKSRDKRVRYWAMTVLGGHEELSNEVDEVRWISIDKLRTKLTYERDEKVVNAFRAYLESGLADHL